MILSAQHRKFQARSEDPCRFRIPAGLLLFFIISFPVGVSAAPFDSGSTGADGPLSPIADTVLPLPPNGVFNFTTITIPAGVTVTFARNPANTPVTLLASGDVDISGSILLDGKDGASVNTPNLPIPIGSGGAGGPGGYAGGAGGLAASWNAGKSVPPGEGLGPGTFIGFFSSYGCSASFRSYGTGPSECIGRSLLYGNDILIPLIGGSGGTGGGSTTSTSAISCPNGCNGGGGGGGGGAILIASSGTITITGTLSATGGNGGTGYIPGGNGSGGGIRLIANTLSITGSVLAVGGTNSHNYRGGEGRIRFESNTLTLSGTVNPTPSIATPGLVNISPLPTLAITAIAGVPVPAGATGSFDSPDITLPSGTSFVPVDIAATNIPVGTTVKIVRTGRNSSSGTFTSTSLSGTDASSTATANISLPAGTSSVLRAEATFTIQTASNPFPAFAGGEKVEQIKVAAAFGGQSTLMLITESGKEMLWMP